MDNNKNYALTSLTNALTSLESETSECVKDLKLLERENVADAVLVHAIDDNLLRVQKCYEQIRKYFLKLCEDADYDAEAMK